MVSQPLRPAPVTTRMVVLAMLLTVLFGSLLIRRVRGIGDEYASIPQIETFRTGTWSVQENLAVPPTYHALIAVIARLFGVSSLDALRLISLLLCLPVVPLFYLCARKIDPDNAALRTLQFLFLPILLPYLFILTTDAPALMLFVLTLYLALHDRPYLAGGAALLDVLVRQNQIVWVAWLFTWLYLREQGWSIRPAAIGRHLLRYWVFCLVFAAFVAFVVINRGLTLGRHQEIHRSGLYLGNVWFALFLCSFLLLPIFLVRLPHVLVLIGRRPWLLIVVGLLFLLYLATFQVNHPMNDISTNPDFLRNQLLAWATTNQATKIVFFLPIALALFSLAALSLHERGSWTLYPFWILAVLPVELIEQRYSLAGVTLLLLFRGMERRGVEMVQFLYFVLVSLAFLLGIAGLLTSKPFFL